MQVDKASEAVWRCWKKAGGAEGQAEGRMCGCEVRRGRSQALWAVPSSVS